MVDVAANQPILFADMFAPTFFVMPLQLFDMTGASAQTVFLDAPNQIEMTSERMETTFNSLIPTAFLQVSIWVPRLAFLPSVNALA
jgi:hypothetical protein